ncbi:methyltransferase [Dinoroseobacter sp. PD6]|uniref:methyltransferase n=1 Tax=Dinoroseobacter sp. PD6 TaxID=3028384 RepID=UPI003FCCEF9F
MSPGTYLRFSFLPEKNAFYRWWVRLAGSSAFQSWASAMPGTRRLARKDGEALFDLVSGFVYSQVLQAFVTLDMPALLAREPLPAWRLAARTRMEPRQMEVLCQAAASLKLLKRRRDGSYQLGRLGAALPGVPGLAEMIRHHDVLYRDLQDPMKFLSGTQETELARFWPYVFGQAGTNDPEIAERYSRLMADSQGLVAEETLRTIDFDGAHRLMDVGGGTGAFLRAVREKHPDLRLRLYDLPAVIEGAALPPGADKTGGSFRDAPALPKGADAISLVRVLYDHADATVADLLRKVFVALPADGRVVVSEPMAGGDQPTRTGDAYFAFYTMAMQTGRARSAQEIADHLTRAGFVDVVCHTTYRPFVTGVVSGRKPA